jgi:spore maturation protein CgeB
MDVSDKNFDRVILPKKYDVTFFGSCVGQGDRIAWLKEINKQVPIQVFGWNNEGWLREEINAEPPVYGQAFVQKVAESKIILGFNVNDHTWGYWSNRVGKILTLGGFLLYRYVPGMELFLRDGVEYFSSPNEAVEKIKYYLEHEDEREKIAQRGYEIGRDRFTSESRVKELCILIDRFIYKAC